MDIAENMRVIIVSKVLEDAGNKQSGFQRLNEGSRLEIRVFYDYPETILGFSH